MIRHLAQYHSIDLARLGLSAGEGRRLDEEVELGALELAGQRYSTAEVAVPVRVEVSRTAGGHAFKLSFDAVLTGPCMRCLADARHAESVESREVDQMGGDEEMTSPYVDDQLLDVGRWAHDALALALPPRILCRSDCAGLCPICGASLNDADPAEHEHGEGRSGPFAALSELRDSSEER